MFDQVNKVLVLAPHPDDAEFGCGGTMAKLLEMGKEVHVAVFSSCDKSLPPGFEPGSILKEMYRSCGSLGIDHNNIHTLDFNVREFQTVRQEILEELIVLRKTIVPDLIFTPCSADIHQDHKTIYEESVRAFKHARLLGYEMPWNNFTYTSCVFVTIKEEHVEQKIKALCFYETQKHRSYNNVEFVTSLARLRGGQIQAKYAESFELIRYLHL